jgi:hypothetical protein
MSDNIDEYNFNVSESFHFTVVCEGFCWGLVARGANIGPNTRWMLEYVEVLKGRDQIDRL